MAGDKTEAGDAARLRDPVAERPILDDAVAGLLEHIAKELAQEYVRLMEGAADDQRRTADPNRDEEG